MDVDAAIRTRRTHKAYAPEPVSPAVLDELFELARWAPNHHLTNPWRFRVLGPRALAALKDAAASVVQTGDPVGDEEDVAAGAAAVFIVLLGAHARGLAGYWRTPGVLRTPEGRAACGIPAGEHVLGLVHLGEARGPGRPAPERAPLDEIRVHLP